MTKSRSSAMVMRDDDEDSSSAGDLIQVGKEEKRPVLFLVAWGESVGRPSAVFFASIPLRCQSN